MKLRIILALVLVCAAVPLAAEDGWITMFNGKNLDGWKASESPSSWKVEDGAIVGRGAVSHLFYMAHECENCEFMAEVKIADKANSGMYFRTAFGPGFPTGYEAQVNSTHTDWKRTGSLYNFVNIKEQLVLPDTWFTQHIIAQGNHIIIKVNEKTAVDFVDDKNTYTKGYLALQQHDPNSVVHYRNLKMKPLK